jgi:alginate O-acetyltransferase complex protein AlgI
MLFNSFHFVAFFLGVLTLNHLLRALPTLQKLMLLAASYYFYGQWSWVYLGIIVYSTLLDYSIGLGMVRVKNPRRLLLLSLATNLGLLAFFKYTNWLIVNWNAGAAAIGSPLQFSALDILLPVGISFYTFQSLSYTIDVYRGVSTPRRNLLDYALFVGFFPQLEAGPIVRDYEFFRELDGDRRPSFADVQSALVLIAFGFVKKMVIADNLAPIVDAVFDAPGTHGFWDCLLAIYAFALQIYGDFSGYTDIAIGCALLLGFRYPQNFNYPYSAQSIQEFWRRWHMSLSRWLRDYLYISLGGNRKGPVRTYVNLFLTMLLGGLWHGASWNFVIWGGLHGSYLAMERAVLSRWALWNAQNVFAVCLRWLVTFHLVCLAWIFFRAKTFGQSIDLLEVLSAPGAARFSVDTHGSIALLLSALVGVHLFSGWAGLKQRLSQAGTPVFAASIGVALLLLIWFTPASTSPFIYFQF